MFAFGFREGATGILYLVRDRMGEKPLFYGINAGDIIFASEVSALQFHPAFADAAPDPLAVYSLLVYEYLPQTQSGWRGIAKLDPGTILSFDAGRIATEHYWRPQLQPAGGSIHREADAIDRLDESLSNSLRDRVVADVPVGTFLSGWLDSSLITAVALKAAPDLTAFSVRVGHDSFDETPHAIDVARYLGIGHKIVELEDADLMTAFDTLSDKLGEPLDDSSLLPT